MEYTYEKMCQIIGNLVLNYTTQLDNKDNQYRELIEGLNTQIAQLTEENGTLNASAKERLEKDRRENESADPTPTPP